MGSTPATTPTVRLLPAPVSEPPYDDERHPDSWADGRVQPELDLVVTHEVRPRPRSTPPPVRTGAAPETRAVAARFVSTCLEILNGYRPVAHFRALAGPQEAGAVLEAMTRAVRHLQEAVRRPDRGGLVKLRTMRTCEPGPGIAEITVVVGAGARPGRGTATPGVPDQAWALAYRLEQRRGQWRCTAAQLVRPRAARLSPASISARPGGQGQAVPAGAP